MFFTILHKVSGAHMIKSIMSYTIQDFQSKSDLIVGGEEWQKVVLKMQSKFAEAEQ